MLDNIRKIVNGYGLSIILAPYSYRNGNKRKLNLFYVIELDKWFSIGDYNLPNVTVIKKKELWKLQKYLLEQ